MGNFTKTFNQVAFGRYIENLPKAKKSELIKSEVLKRNNEIRRAFTSQGGTGYAILPMYGRIEGDASNYDGVSDIEPKATKTFERGVVVIGRANAWLEDDFSEDITGGVSFMSNVARQVGEYFDEVDQDTLINILKGIFGMTGAQNKDFVDNHTYDITTEAESEIGITTLNNAIQKACGDNKSKFAIVIMHSMVATNLENLNLLNYMKYTDINGMQRDLGLGTLNGKVVLIDDSMPVETSEDGNKYTTYVLGKGAIDFEDIGAKVPYEIHRDPKANGGQSTLYARTRKCFAPFGISYTKKSQVTLSPTNAELSDGRNWSLVKDTNEGQYIDHKTIPIARIISRG
ncbi:MAG: phage coat protein [Eubacteriales bacterium]|nr:phage coat protein [Eubacteriales bacterium]